MNIAETTQNLDFTLLGNDENSYTLKDFRGKKVILYFYPKDNTPACTNEALLFRDHLEDLTKLNCIIIGISRDSIVSHNKFIAKYDLNFLLLSDPDETVCNLFEVMKEKNLYGKKSIGIERSTFIFDENGLLVKAYRKVKVAGHVEEILEFLKELK